MNYISLQGHVFEFFDDGSYENLDSLDAFHISGVKSNPSTETEKTKRFYVDLIKEGKLSFMDKLSKYTSLRRIDNCRRKRRKM